MSDPSIANAEKMANLNIRLPASEIPALQRVLNTHWYSDLYKEAEASRDADHAGQVKSLERLLDVAFHQTGSGARVCAKLLASCYNGQRFQLDLTDLRLLDDELFEHAINVLRLDHAPVQEIHCYFENGSNIWEQMIKKWRFEKPKRRSKTR